MDFWADAKRTVCFQVSNVDSPVAKKKLQMCHFTKRWVVSLYKDSAKVIWIRGFRASRVDDCRSSTWSSFHSPFHDTWCIKAIEQSTYSIHSQYVQYRNLMKLVWYTKFMIYIIHTDINLIMMPPTFLMYIFAYISALHNLALASRSAEALVQQLRALTTSKSDEGGRMSGIGFEPQKLGWCGAFLVKVRRFLTKVFMCFSTHNGCGHSLT